MRRCIGILTGVLTGVALIGGVPLTEDPPVTAPPKAGDITGQIVSDEPIGSIVAVSRVTGREYAAASFDGKTGRFTFRHMPGDAAYDLRARIGQRTVEGIDLRFVDARMLRLGQLRRQQLHLPPEREHEFCRADVDEILRFIRDIQDFMEIRRVLYVQGRGTRATVLVELLRTREFYASNGEVIWRVELWYFQEKFGGWERLAKQEQVLHRRRIRPAEWRTIHLEYYPELSLYIDPEGKSTPVRFTPPKPDLARGRLPNTDPKVATAPHVLGLTGPETSTSRPASRPETGE
jgi:hypothetical protein